MKNISHFKPLVFLPVLIGGISTVLLFNYLGISKFNYAGGIIGGSLGSLIYFSIKKKFNI